MTTSWWRPRGQSPICGLREIGVARREGDGGTPYEFSLKLLLAFRLPSASVQILQIRSGRVPMGNELAVLLFSTRFAWLGVYNGEGMGGGVGVWGRCRVGEELAVFLGRVGRCSGIGGFFWAWGFWCLWLC